MTQFLMRLTEGGELTPEEDAYYAKLLQDAKGKCDSYVGAILYLESQLEGAAAVQKVVNAKVAKWKNAADRVRRNLATFMHNQGVKELRPANPALPCVYLQNGRRKLDIQPEKLPEGLYDTDTVIKPDKDKIEEALKGGEVPGVTVTFGEPFIRVS